MKNISNKDFLAKYEDSFETIDSVCRRFRTSLSKDVLRSCGNVGLWKCMKNFDKNKGKFSSYLYYCVFWECLLAIREIESVTEPLNEDIYYDEKTKQKVEYLLSFLNEKEKRMIKGKFFFMYTLKEIGEQEGFSKQRAGDIIKKAIKKIKQRHE